MRALTFAGLIIACPGLASAQDYGPDPTGYFGNDIPANFLDISISGTDVTGLLSGLDDGGVNVPLGFSFDFYGSASTTLGFSTNGYLTGGTDLTDFTADCPMPNAIDPNRGIYPYFSDLRLSEHGSMQHETFGLAPNQVFIAQWTDVGSFDDSTANITMQVRLFETDDAIEFHYDELVSGSLGTYDATGGEGAVGIEDNTGANALTIACNNPGALTTTNAFRIEAGATPPPPPPISDYAFTTIAPSFMDISGTGTDVTGSLTGLDDGGVVVPIGFAFDFYSTTITSIGFSTNGYLADNPDLTDFTADCPMPNPIDPNRGIYPYFSDLRLTEHGSMQHQTVGLSPARIFIAQWTDVGSFDDSTAHVTMQAKLLEGCNEIEFHYDSLDSGTAGTYEATGGEGAVGVEGNGGTIATTIGCNVAGTLATTTAFRIAIAGVQQDRFPMGGPNPGTFNADPAGGPTIGLPWQPSVSGALGAPTFDAVIVSLAGPIDVPTPFGTLLSNIVTPLLQFNFAPGTPFSISIPNDCSLVGQNITTQGASIALGPLTIQLTNGLDIIPGSL